ERHPWHRPLEERARPPLQAFRAGGSELLPGSPRPRRPGRRRAAHRLPGRAYLPRLPPDAGPRHLPDLALGGQDRALALRALPPPRPPRHGRPTLGREEGTRCSACPGLSPPGWLRVRVLPRRCPDPATRLPRHPGLRHAAQLLRRRARLRRLA